MAPVGAGGIDLRNMVANVFHLFKSKANGICTAPCDGFVLKMHYRWTFCMFLAFFFTVWYQWYHREIITCASHFNADTQVRVDYINICLSYPFVLRGTQKRFLLFYRWISWAFLFIAGLYYIPRKASKTMENPKVKKLFEEIAANSFRYDHSERELTEKAARYITVNMNTHNALYYKNLVLNTMALLIDVFVVMFINFILQGRFLRYGILASSISRDPEEFTDFMSDTFPPFASCRLTKEHQIVAKRVETFGCHLTFMELYEKIFLFLWFWLFVLLISCVGYIMFLLVMNIPVVKFFLLKPFKPFHYEDRSSLVVNMVCRKCRIGDVYFLYRLKQHLSHAAFLELLTRLSDPELGRVKMPQTRVYNGDGETLKKPQLDTLKTRKAAAVNMSPEVYHQLLASNDVDMTRSEVYLDQRTQYMQKNTSILIE